MRTLGRNPAEIALSVAGMELWHRIRSLVDDDCGFQPCGQVKVAESMEHVAELERRAETVRRMGFAHEEVVDQAELRRLVPAIAPHCVGALVVRNDGAADPYRTTTAFGRKAVALGVDLIEGEGVIALEREQDAWVVVGNQSRYRAPIVVNAAGAWAARVAAMAGEAIPLKTRVSMMIVTERMPPFVKPVVGSAGRKLSFKQTAAGTVLIGGGQQGRADLDREQCWVIVDNLSRAAEAAAALFPLMRRAAIVRTWAGIEAETPDAIPVIGWSRVAPALIHVFGFSGHGFQLGPICGRAVADLAVDGKTDLQIGGLSVSRFTDADK